MISLESDWKIATEASRSVSIYSLLIEYENSLVVHFWSLTHWAELLIFYVESFTWMLISEIIP
jgi:hypothetical protein